MTQDVIPSISAMANNTNMTVRASCFSAETAVVMITVL